MQSTPRSLGADVSLPPVIFVILQSKADANGGIASIGQVIARLRHHRPIIVTDCDNRRLEQWRRDGIETHVVEQTLSQGSRGNPLRAIASYWRYTRELRKLIKSSGAAVVHANDPAAVQLAILPAKLTGAKLVWNIRGTFDPDHPPSQWKYALLFSAVDHVLFLSHDMARRWGERFPKATAACSVTYSIVDPERFRPLPRDDADGPLVLVSGLIRPLKGQLEFITHVAPVLAREGVKTWFAGDFHPDSDPYMAACAKAAAPLGKNVRFLGYRTDLPELMAKANVVAVTSHHEGLVRAMIETMGCARPVVSFDVCSAREILEAESDGAGTVVERGDFAAMASAILDYCRNPKLAREAGTKGAAAAARLFAPDSVVSLYERVYDRLAQKPAAAGEVMDMVDR